VEGAAGTILRGQVNKKDDKLRTLNDRGGGVRRDIKLKS